MSPLRTALLAVAAAASLMAAGAGCRTAAPAVAAETGRAFEATLAEVDAAQGELLDGRPDRYKALWSRADDVTLSGGLGGAIARGWADVSGRLDWVATQFTRGRATRERVAVHVGGEVAYVVQAERLSFYAPGAAEESTREYRVTMIFRWEGRRWRMVHRQADANVAGGPAR